ncbi:MAG: 30S ribosomal protein S5 [archaeon]
MVTKKTETKTAEKTEAEIKTTIVTEAPAVPVEIKIDGVAVDPATVTEAVEDVTEKVIEKTEEEFVKKRSTRSEEMRASRLKSWVPKTRLGIEVRGGKIKDIKEIFDTNRKILEAEVVDLLLTINSELLLIGQSKGKFGGGKKRAWKQTQRKTAEGNQSSFACMTVVGNGDGYVGVGYGKAKETLPAREKSERHAKINLIRVRRGCGSFDCGCAETHSIPFRVQGKCASAVMILLPAPKGTGLVIEDECKKMLKLAGIKDIYSKTFGQTRTKINLVKACFLALKKLDEMKKTG